MQRDGWYYEDYVPHWGQAYEIEEILYQGATEFQKVLIFKNGKLGKVLVLDDVIQSTQLDENVYHEMMTFTPILAHGQVRDVLIIGGGDGGMLRHCLMHDIDRVTMVDIDPEVVALCREHMPEWSREAYEDPRARYIAGDGIAYVRDTDERFDVIIVDGTDPFGPGEVLYREEFYRLCRNAMRPDGIITMQSGVPHIEPKRVPNLKRNLGAVFADVTVYIATVPTYHGGYMAFGWGSDDPALRRQPLQTIEKRYHALNQETLFYSPAMHVAAFSHPRFLEKQLEQ